MSAFAVDDARFLRDLRALRAIGAHGAGVVRPALSARDIEARAWLIGRLRDAGLTPSADAYGNVFGMPPGARPLLLGSHTDTQPEGGWLDGALGVIAALEIARAARASGGPPIAVVSFQDEEGRFGGLTGSRIWTGALSPADADALSDAAGLTMGESRRAATALDPGPAPAPDAFSGFLELHIEQGPVLDEAGESVAVVEAIVGSREISVVYDGEQNHAGTTPMARRRDAFKGLARLSERLDAALPTIATPSTVWTIGRVELRPNAGSIVPGRAEFSLQWRDAETERLDRMETMIREEVAAAAAKCGLEARLEPRSRIEPTLMDRRMVEALAEAAETVAPGRWRRLPSGAIHDAGMVAARMPAAMLFAASIGGRSHCFEEDSREEDLVAALKTLAQAAARLAG